MKGACCYGPTGTDTSSHIHLPRVLGNKERGEGGGGEGGKNRKRNRETQRRRRRRKKERKKEKKKDRKNRIGYRNRIQDTGIFIRQVHKNEECVTVTAQT